MESTWESHLPLARNLCFFSVRIRWERVRKRLTVGLASQFLLGGHGLTKCAPIIVNIKPSAVIAAENMRDVRLRSFQQSIIQSQKEFGIRTKSWPRVFTSSQLPCKTTRNGSLVSWLAFNLGS